MTPLQVSGVSKTFTMHLQHGLRLPVFRDLSFSVEAGQCLVLTGPSGVGKSSVLKLVFGNYLCDEGSILVRTGAAAVDIANATPRQMLSIRQYAIGYVTQFLRAIPRISALDTVADAISDVKRDEARDRAAAMLSRFNIPERLWNLPPATFSGGEQQRVNLARALLPERPILLLDEPTASLDAANRSVVVDLVRERKQTGVAVVAIVHDEPVRDAIADATLDITQFSAAA
jgi:alpha-D-ribose 1-methylphosphonate 5-triphosphate synthase subunit PhnL